MVLAGPTLAFTSPLPTGDSGSVPTSVPGSHGGGSAAHPERSQSRSQGLAPRAAVPSRPQPQPCPAARALPAEPSGAPGAAAARGLPCSSVRCCSLHSVQGNQTVWIFWSFIVKLFPNSNSFKCHHANGKEKPFMQLQSVFLRCYAFCWVTESEFTVH